MENQYRFSSARQGTLTAVDVRRLRKGKGISILDGDIVKILDKSKLFKRELVDEKGNRIFNKKGEPIVEWSVIFIIKRHDTGMLFTSRATLDWFNCNDMVQESECPLDLCHDGVRKYAAAWKLTHINAHAEVDIPLYPGQDCISTTITLTGKGQVEGFQLPSVSDVFVKSSNGTYVNKEGLGDTLKLTKTQRTVLTPIAYDFTKNEMKQAMMMRDAAQADFESNKNVC